MRKLRKVAATLGGIAVASTVAFGASVAFASSAQADFSCSLEDSRLTCTRVVVEQDTPHNNWTTETTSTFKPFHFNKTTDTVVKNPAREGASRPAAVAPVGARLSRKCGPPGRKYCNVQSTA
jgi:hypothetical protein